jgi:hypothetical protein
MHTRLKYSLMLQSLSPLIAVMMCASFSRATLYYTNPVLAILDYRVYKIQFQENKVLKAIVLA